MAQETPEYCDEPRLARSPTARAVLFVAGTGFVALGVIGVLLPVLPTTPFLLAAAACYSRGSARFYYALLNNRLFGPLIREWQRTRTIPRKAKWLALAVLAATLATSVVALDHNRYLQLGLIALGVVLAIHLARIPCQVPPKAKEMA